MPVSVPMATSDACATIWMLAVSSVAAEVPTVEVDVTFPPVSSGVPTFAVPAVLVVAV